MAEPDSKRAKADPNTEEDRPEEDEEQAARELNNALTEIDAIQDELERITDEASDRVLAIEQEYTKKRRPVYAQRSKMLQMIPRFWVHALTKHPTINAMLTDDDIEVLNFCTEVDVEDFEDIKSGFQITMTFEPDNPFFTNATLSKTFKYAEDGTLTIKSSEIDWKEGMRPDLESVGHKRGRKDYRFMLWFLDEELEAGQHDELADIIKDDLWPNPVRYFVEQVEEGEEEDLEYMEEAGGDLEVYEGDGEEGGDEEGQDDGGEAEEEGEAEEAS